MKSGPDTLPQLILISSDTNFCITVKTGGSFQSRTPSPPSSPHHGMRVQYSIPGAACCLLYRCTLSKCNAKNLMGRQVSAALQRDPGSDPDPDPDPNPNPNA
ncbi:hypothetical protein TcWFU_005621 [Taenia crassiceps]|uniref:Uncharacterized protein n=1 Tax=Taenia crassiceps TaxID=6207 RepID=A0ABR4QRH4_9CEST